MIMSWGDLDVRVYAARAWVALAPRFAADHPVIVDKLEAILADPVPAVRFQAAHNLQVLSVVASERMWALGERIAAGETNMEVLASYLNRPMWLFCHSDPERCEAVLAIVKGRIDGHHSSNRPERNPVLGSLGNWAAQLFAGQGRPLARNWLETWAHDPERYGELLDSFAAALRAAFFHRYAPNAEAAASEMCDRAQEGLALILTAATEVSVEAYTALATEGAEVQKEMAAERYRAAEMVIHHAVDQLYFGSGAYAENRGGGPGLVDPPAMARFLVDYARVLAVFARSREPATLHRLVELYEFLIPGDPVMVFEAIYAMLLGRGKEEGYHYESLGNTAVVRIVQRYIADYRVVFEDEGQRARLVAILQLFSEVGWTDALKLLYDLPDLLR